MGCPMRGVHALVLCLLAGLALSGCIYTTAPVATAQPPSDLDYMAYGEPHNSAPAATVPVMADSGGAFAALRASFAASPQRRYAPARAAYAAVPMPVAHDTAYRLPARDKPPAGGASRG